jgi:hypothetical protein
MNFNSANLESNRDNNHLKSLCYSYNSHTLLSIVIIKQTSKYVFHQTRDLQFYVFVYHIKIYFYLFQINNENGVSIHDILKFSQ